MVAFLSQVIWLASHKQKCHLTYFTHQLSPTRLINPHLPCPKSMQLINFDEILIYLSKYLREDSQINFSVRNVKCYGDGGLGVDVIDLKIDFFS